ncbi:MAG TPA: WD40 repeat domain-containing protein [Candidatus Babeliales bacterium]|nr:WD40 repeat domain-containing protein [Candidatus Babeliales bacterium]
MKYWSILFIMHTFAIPSLCSAMDCLAEITYIPNPTCVAFLDDYRVVIGGDRCITLNLINAKTRQLDPTQIFHITLSNDGTRFALSSRKKLAIFSTFTEKQRWKQKPLTEGSAIVFSPTGSSLFAYFPGKLTSYNWFDKELETHGVQSFTQFPTVLISCHPTEKKLLYPSSANTLSTIDPDNDYAIEKVCTTKDPVIAGTYGPDGNIIAVNNHYRGCCLYNPKTKYCCNLLLNIYENIVGIAFHKSRPILVVLIDNNAIQYWNYRTNALIATRTGTTDPQDWIDYPYLTQRLAFSPNGEKLIVALKNKCLVLQVPKNNIIMLYRLLKHHGILPEIIKLILYKLALFFKFHQINFAELIKT